MKLFAWPDNVYSNLPWHEAARIFYGEKINAQHGDIESSVPLSTGNQAWVDSEEGAKCGESERDVGEPEGDRIT